MSAPCCVYDLTFNGENLPEIDAVKQCFSLSCKEWAFQKEAGNESGRVHLQARISLKVKERITGVIKKFPGWHISVTSNENRGNMFYVLKEETRLAGPWTSKDVVIYVPRQVREVSVLYPWQMHIIRDATVWNTRTINVVIDTVGNSGKSVLKSWIMCHGIGISLPYSNDFRDISRMVMDQPKKSLYLIDIPRALKKDALHQFFAGLESLKDGIAFDDRYKFRTEQFDCPNIWIFMNQVPNLNYLSQDRWRIWSIDGDRELVSQNEALDSSEASSSEENVEELNIDPVVVPPRRNIKILNKIN